MDSCTFIVCLVIPLGVNVITGSIMKEITKEADGTMTVHLENGKVTITEIKNVPIFPSL